MFEEKEWFHDGDFWERFAPVIFDDRRWREVPLVADSVTRFSKLNLYGEVPRPAPRILDVCCGFGRLTLEFARRGFVPTGVDITESYLAAGKEDAAAENLAVEFVREDVRRFRRPESFDAAVNLYTSFGYFARAEDDVLLLKNVFDSLISGGVFIVETLGKEIAVRDFVEAEWFERAGRKVLTEYEVLDSWSRLRNRWIIVQDGVEFERVFVQRLYCASELGALFAGAGFVEVGLYGSWNEDPYDQRAETLICVGRKP